MAVVRPFRAKWQKIVENQGNLENMDKKSFPSLKNILLNSIKPDSGISISGFRKSRLFPLNKIQILNEELFAISDTFQVSSSPTSSCSTVSANPSSSTVPICDSPGQILKRQTSLSEESKMDTV